MIVGEGVSIVAIWGEGVEILTIDNVGEGVAGEGVVIVAGEGVVIFAGEGVVIFAGEGVVGEGVVIFAGEGVVIVAGEGVEILKIVGEGDGSLKDNVLASTIEVEIIVNAVCANTLPVRLLPDKVDKLVFKIMIPSM